MWLTLIATCLLATQGWAKTELKDLVTLCSKSDPKNAECIKTAANILIPKFADGIKDLGVYHIDPLKVPFLELNQADRPVGLKLNISDAEHKGLREAVVTNVVSDKDGLKLGVDMKIPSYQITGHCDVGGRILLLPITGHGPCNLTANSLDAKLTILFSGFEKHGKRHLKIDSLVVKLKTRKGHFLLKGLFGNNKELGDTMNRFLNENSADVLNELKPTLEAAWSEIFGSILKRFFDKIPIQNLSLP